MTKDTIPFEPRDREWQPKPLTPAYKSTRLRAPGKPLIVFENTLTEMTGPVFGHDVVGKLDNNLILNFSNGRASAIGQRIIVHGRILDTNGYAIPDVLVEIWQANAAGRYRHENDDYVAPLDPNFGGGGRAITGQNGEYQFITVRPAPYPWPNTPNAWRPAHIHFSVFGQGFAQRLITQMYFEGDPLIPLCPIVQGIDNPAAVEKLIARLDIDKTTPMDAMAYQFDIVLRGRNETLFENRE